VVAQDVEGFTVQEADGGKGSYEFDYRIMAKVRGQEETRLEAFTVPTAPPPPRVPVLEERRSEEVAASELPSTAPARMGAVSGKNRR
jgi:hypothetical protein